MRPHEVAFGHKRQAQGSWAARVLAPQPVPMACAIEHMPEADGTDTSAATRMPHAASALLVYSRLPAGLPTMTYRWLFVRCELLFAFCFRALCSWSRI